MNLMEIAQKLTAGELADACGREGRDDLTVLVLGITEAEG